MLFIAIRTISVVNSWILIVSSDHVNVQVAIKMHNGCAIMLEMINIYPLNVNIGTVEQDV